jgi:hypothetical protein
MWEELSTSIQLQHSHKSSTSSNVNVSDEHLGHIFETFMTVVARSVLPKEPADTVTYLNMPDSRSEIKQT